MFVRSFVCLLACLFVSLFVCFFVSLLACLLACLFVLVGWLIGWLAGWLLLLFQVGLGPSTKARQVNGAHLHLVINTMGRDAEGKHAYQPP